MHSFMRESAIPSSEGAPSTDRENRRDQRLIESCYLTYSGIYAGLVIVGEGSSVDLSGEGFGIEGSRAVVPDTLLTLCLCLPDGNEPLVVEEVRVAWVQGNRFGVQSVAIGHDERQRLLRFVTMDQQERLRASLDPLDFCLPLESLAS